VARSIKHQNYITRRSNQNAAQFKEDIGSAQEARRKALEDLEKLQQGRPMKPPGRR
jgi:hypothetical protein